jgi:hypothetical protein
MRIVVMRPRANGRSLAKIIGRSLQGLRHTRPSSSFQRKRKNFRIRMSQTVLTRPKSDIPLPARFGPSDRPTRTSGCEAPVRPTPWTQTAPALKP